MSTKFKFITCLVIEALLFCGVLFTCNNQYKHDLETGELNYAAAVDSLHKVQLKKDKDILFWKQSCVTSDKNLLMEKKERKEVEKQLHSEIAYLSKLKSEVKYDTIRMPGQVIRDTTDIISKFDYNDKWLQLSGVTKITPTTSNTTIYNINIPVPLKVGLTEDYQIFVKTPNPYLNITDVQGAVLDKSKLYPKEKKFSFGVHGGIGAQYGLVNKKFDVGPYVGVGVSYKLF